MKRDEHSSILTSNPDDLRGKPLLYCSKSRDGKNKISWMIGGANQRKLNIVNL